MGNAGFVTLFLCAIFLLCSFVSSNYSPHNEPPSALTASSVVRNKRQFSAQELLENVLHRTIDVEDEVVKTQTALEGLHGYFTALGFGLNVTEGTLLNKPSNPCGSQDDFPGQTEINWTPFGTSKCVKLVSGLFRFFDATKICRQEYKMGEDISYPQVVSVDSSEKANKLLQFLHPHQSVTSVWVDRKNYSSSSSFGLNCTELRVSSANVTSERVDWKNVECDRLNRVVCEKTFPVSYSLMVGKQLESADKIEELEKQLQNAYTQIGQLKDNITSLNESFREEVTVDTNSWKEILRAEFKAEVSQLQNKFSTREAKMILEVKRLGERCAREEARLRDEVKLERKLEDLQAEVEAEKRLRTAEAVEMRSLLRKLESVSSSKV